VALAGACGRPALLSALPTIACRTPGDNCDPAAPRAGSTGFKAY